MKKLKKLTLLSGIMIFASIFYWSCNGDEAISSHVENTSSSNSIKSVNSDINQAYDLVYEDGNRKLSVLLNKKGNVYENTFTYFDTNNNVQLFSLDYSFDNSIDRWKYAEQQKAIDFATTLKDLNIGITELNKLNFILDDSYINLFSEVSENNLNEDLFSIIAYLKSAVSANIRMIEEKYSVIEGTISPSFLVGKSHFVFQEDLYFDMNVLKENIGLLEREANASDYIGDKNLVSFIKTTNKQKVRFDELYSNYVSKSDFKIHIENEILKAGDCSESCYIGCGTDWGCCASYTGCCYYSSLGCLIHDLQCTECIPPEGYPSWYCLPGCKPDGPEGNRPVKVLISLAI